MYLHFFNKKTESLPLDWIVSNSFESTINLFNNRFQDFISNPQLLVNSKKKVGLNAPEWWLTQNKVHKETYVYSNPKYNIDFYHDFPKDSEFKNTYPCVKKKYLRRINRLYDYLTENLYNLKFIFYYKGLNNNNLLIFKNILYKINPKLSYKLYIITNNRDIKNTYNQVCHYIDYSFERLFTSKLSSCPKLKHFIKNA